MEPITPNTFIVSGIVWILGTILKKTKLPNDMIPQVLYYASLGSAYLLAVLQGLMVGTAHAATAAPVAIAPFDAAAQGSTAWILVNAWDWLGRKLLFGKLLKPLLKVGT